MVRIIKGEVLSGTGRGAGFIALPIYNNIFSLYLNDSPYHGTLNIKLNDEDATHVNQKFEQGHTHEELVSDGKKYGGIVIIKVRLVGKPSIPAVGVRPLLTTHQSDILEIVSATHLRSLFNVTDGDELIISV